MKSARPNDEVINRIPYDQAFRASSRTLPLGLFRFSARCPICQNDNPRAAGLSAPALGAALINGTAAHCLDFDETHVPSIAHLSAPTWAAVLAAATDCPISGYDLLRSYIAGFEVGATLGSRGNGETVTRRGLHSTAVFGRFSATAALCAVWELDLHMIMNAFGVAATQVAGLTASFGTMSKPFHAGKAAMDGVLSA